MKFNGYILAQEYSSQVYYTGVLSFEKVLFSRSSADQTSHKKDLHLIFCERSQSGSRIRRKG